MKHSKARIAYMSMKARCVVNGCFQQRNPTYIGCTISNDFQNFKFFENWYISQIGYNCENYHLDKDILIHGNQVYSPNTCVLVPAALNQFLTLATFTRGSLPIGVSQQNSNKFKSAVRINSKLIHLGTFETIADAAIAYKNAKEHEAKRWADRLIAREFEVDPRVIERLIKWELII